MRMFFSLHSGSIPDISTNVHKGSSEGLYAFLSLIHRNEHGVMLYFLLIDFCHEHERQRDTDATVAGHHCMRAHPS